MTEIKLGDTVRCVVTGFTGVATAKVVYLNGCVQYGVQPHVDKDGKMPDSVYIDFQRLEVTAVGAGWATSPAAAAVGGPARDQPRGEYRG